jgi:hypothetical protein
MLIDQSTKEQMMMDDGDDEGACLSKRWQRNKGILENGKTDHIDWRIHRIMGLYRDSPSSSRQFFSFMYVHMYIQ